METSPNIHQRMLKVMEDVESVQKDQYNPQGGFRYASHNAVTTAIRPMLVKHGIALGVSVEEPEIFDMRMRNYDAQGVRGVVMVEYINVDRPEDRYVSRIPAADVLKEGKGYGSLLSYGVKYSFNKCFAMLADDDEDVDASTGPSDGAKRERKYDATGDTSKATEKQINAINAKAKAMGLVDELKAFAIENDISRDTMTKEQAQKLFDWFDQQKPDEGDAPWG